MCFTEKEQQLPVCVNDGMIENFPFRSFVIIFVYERILRHSSYNDISANTEEPIGLLFVLSDTILLQ